MRGYNPSNHVGGNPLNTNIVNGVSGIGPSITSTYAVFGTKGGDLTGATNDGFGGGGGIGGAGGNYNQGLAITRNNLHIISTRTTSLRKIYCSTST
jgi:hypothetical protein